MGSLSLQKARELLHASFNLNPLIHHLANEAKCPWINACRNPRLTNETSPPVCFGIEGVCNQYNTQPWMQERMLGRKRSLIEEGLREVLGRKSGAPAKNFQKKPLPGPRTGDVPLGY